MSYRPSALDAHGTFRPKGALRYHAGRMVPAFLLYIGGVCVGLFLSDAPPATRLALALLWPVGPVAFLVTISVLIVAGAIAFPLFGACLAAAIAAAWWFVRG